MDLTIFVLDSTYTQISITVAGLAVIVLDSTQIPVLVVDLAIFVWDSTQIPVPVVDLAIFVYNSTQIHLLVVDLQYLFGIVSKFLYSWRTCNICWG